MKGQANTLLPRSIASAIEELEGGMSHLRSAVLSQFDDGNRPVTGENVRLVIAARQLRSELLPANFFSEPAWDMLLEVFARDLEGREGCLSEIAGASSIRLTTALRWVEILEDQGLLTRRADPSDARRGILQLSNLGKRVMELYFRERNRLGR